MKEKESMHHEAINTINLPKRDKAKMVWMIIAIIALVALVGVSVYGYMQMQKTNQKIKDQQAQIDDLENKRKALEDAAAAAAKAATDAAAKAVTNAAGTQTESDKNQIIASSGSYCVGANKLDCNPTIKKQLSQYADVELKNGNHLLVTKNSNSSWSVILASEGSLCDVGTDGPAVAGINALCGR